MGRSTSLRALCPEIGLCEGSEGIPEVRTGKIKVLSVGFCWAEGKTESQKLRDPSQGSTRFLEGFLVDPSQGSTRFLKGSLERFLVDPRARRKMRWRKDIHGRVWMMRLALEVQDSPWEGTDRAQSCSLPQESQD